MRFKELIEGLQSEQPRLHAALLVLAQKLEIIFNNFDANTEGVRLNETKISKLGLVESLHGFFFRKTLESELPVCAIYRDTGIRPGAGFYTWNTVDYESAGFFTRITADTQIKISKIGKYMILFHGIGFGVAAGTRGDVKV